MLFIKVIYFLVDITPTTTLIKAVTIILFMPAIKAVHAREILDSRGNPTVEVDVLVDDFIARASVPSGASKGKHEAVELRDARRKRYLGMGVRGAVRNVQRFIAPALRGKDCTKQWEIDEALIHADGTANKRDLGANALLGVSMAACRAGAHASGMPLFAHVRKLAGTRRLALPKLFFNIINGGKHAGTALAIQECMIVPQVKSTSESIRIASETYHTLKQAIVRKYGRFAANVGDEGGFAPPIRRVEDALDLIEAAVQRLGYGRKVRLALDCAASTFYQQGLYHLAAGQSLRASELLDYYLMLARAYPIIALEDPFHEEDFDHFAELARKLRGKALVVADDLTATNPQRILLAARKHAASCLLLKPNQIGTVSEAMEAARLARKHGWRVMVSHRSGETTDDFIADFAVGIGADFLKAGAPARGERVAKYNQLLRIGEVVGSG